MFLEDAVTSTSPGIQTTRVRLQLWHHLLTKWRFLPKLLEKSRDSRGARQKSSMRTRRFSLKWLRKRRRAPACLFPNKWTQWRRRSIACLSRIHAPGRLEVRVLVLSLWHCCFFRRSPPMLVFFLTPCPFPTVHCSLSPARCLSLAVVWMYVMSARVIGQHLEAGCLHQRGPATYENVYFLSPGLLSLLGCSQGSLFRSRRSHNPSQIFTFPLLHLFWWTRCGFTEFLTES